MDVTGRGVRGLDQGMREIPHRGNPTPSSLEPNVQLRKQAYLENLIHRDPGRNESLKGRAERILSSFYHVVYAPDIATLDQSCARFYS